jgi:hypothetical protein
VLEIWNANGGPGGMGVAQTSVFDKCGVALGDDDRRKLSRRWPLGGWAARLRCRWARGRLCAGRPVRWCVLTFVWHARESREMAWRLLP